MELLWLKYFKKLAESEHLTHVAEQLYISAPSLSATISKLEKELGVQLFDRTGRGLCLNNNGKMFLGYANTILDTIDEVKNKFKTANDISDNHLSIGVTSPSRYQRVLLSFLKDNPDISLSHCIIDLLHFNSEDLLQYDFVLSASIDFNVGNSASTVIYSDDIPMLSVYASHPFSPLSEISLYQASKEVFIVTPKGTSARIYFDDLFSQAQIKPNIIFECDYSMRKKLIIDKFGIGLSTLSSSIDDGNSELKYIKITEPNYRRSHIITWHLKHNRSKAADLFYNYICSYYKSGIYELSLITN